MREPNFKNMPASSDQTSGDGSTSNINLDATWNKVRKGDEEALGRLFGAMFDSLYSYGYRIIPQTDDVRDAIQEVFFQLWKYREGVSCPNSVRAYLFTSLRHELLKKKKASTRHDKLCHKYVAEEFDPLINYNSWEEIFNLDEDDGRALKQAVENLTPRQREAIYLKYFEGLSNEELSKVLKMRAQSVYNLIFNALKNLRNFLNS